MKKFLRITCLMVAFVMVLGSMAAFAVGNDVSVEDADVSAEMYLSILDEYGNEVDRIYPKEVNCPEIERLSRGYIAMQPRMMYHDVATNGPFFRTSNGPSAGINWGNFRSSINGRFLISAQVNSSPGRPTLVLTDVASGAQTQFPLDQIGSANNFQFINRGIISQPHQVLNFQFWTTGGNWQSANIDLRRQP